MNGKMTTGMGEVTIDKEVLARFAGSATTECFGIVGMATVNVKDGVSKLLKRENVSKGVSLQVIDNKIVVELHVIVAYGVSIKAVTQNVLENVKARMENFTGLDVEKIIVIVDGVRVVDD